MAIEVWPTLRTAAQHLSEVNKPHPNSFLPHRNYASMNFQQFALTLASDLFQFIMDHDVKCEDIEDYLYDIMDLMMVQEELSGGSSNPASIENMSLYTMKVIGELQEGRRDRIVEFEENVYRKVKEFQGEVVVQDKKVEEGDEVEG